MNYGVKENKNKRHKFVFIMSKNSQLSNVANKAMAPDTANNMVLTELRNCDGTSRKYVSYRADHLKTRFQDQNLSAQIQNQDIGI